MPRKELKDLQKRLSEIEATHARLLHHLPGMAYRCKVQKDYEYTMIFASKGCEKLLEMRDDAIMQHPTNTIESLTVEEDLAKMRTSIHEALLERRSYQIYYRIRVASGGLKWIWDQGEGVFDEQGECLFLEGIMMDVTAQKTKEQKLKQENRQLRKAPRESGGLGKIVGKSAPMLEAFDLMSKAAKSDTSVILYGETGVGKDLAAKTIHDLSGLTGRFIPVNCAAIPDQLLESEFFGHVKGAFSGAVTNRPGYLAAAYKGTLFLDEIAELPLNLQVKLLRALETKTYTPVGSNEVRSADFRLISATNRDLAEMVRQKAMRADFYYRVHVLTILLPPLRERKGDIPLLVQSYARYKGIDQPLPPELLASFEADFWPGNVRELQNTLERYWAFGENGITMRGNSPDIFSVDVDPRTGRPGPFQAPPLESHHSPALPNSPHPTLPAQPRVHPAAHPAPPHPDGVASSSMPAYAPCGGEAAAQASSPHPAAPSAARPAYKPAPATPWPASHTSDTRGALTLSDARCDIEKQRILEALDRHGWKKGKTADSLGITMRTLQRKLKKYGLDRKSLA